MVLEWRKKTELGTWRKKKEAPETPPTPTPEAAPASPRTGYSEEDLVAEKAKHLATLRGMSAAATKQIDDIATREAAHKQAMLDELKKEDR